MIGIDLGTTYSCVGIVRNGKVEVIPNDQGNRITPSYVAFTSDGQRLIGDAAKNQLTTNPQNTLFDIKRFIGREWSDPVVQMNIPLYPFKISEKEARPVFEIHTGHSTRTFSAEEISAMVLLKMKESAEAYLGVRVENAVITVPAYFNDAQRQATKNAGEIAGLNVTRIINEPTAASLAFGLGYNFDMAEVKNVMVFDLGGGTFDVSVLTIGDGAFEVISTNGNTNLGGEDFDQNVVAHLMNVFKDSTQKSLKGDKKAIQKLRREAEYAKRSLSTYTSVRIEVDSLIQGQDFITTLTRSKFEELNMELFKSTLTYVQKALKDAGLKKTEIDEVILVGGSTRIPKIRQLLREWFDKEPNTGVNADEAVAYGAAVQAAILSHDPAFQDYILMDITPLSLGIESSGGVMAKLIPRNERIPVSKSQIFTTAKDNQPDVHIQVYEGERSVTEENHLLGR